MSTDEPTPAPSHPDVQTEVSEAAGRTIAFLTGPRKWFVLALLIAAGVTFGRRRWIEDDYWAPLCVKAAVGCGFFAILQLLPVVEASRLVRSVLALT